MDHLRPSWDHLAPKTGPRYGVPCRRGELEVDFEWFFAMFFRSPSEFGRLGAARYGGIKVGSKFKLN